LKTAIETLDASLRKVGGYTEKIHKAESRSEEAQQPENPQVVDAVGRTVLRRNEPLHVFSTCPAPELALNKAEFWKTKEAGQAFRLMYEATAVELSRFDFRNPPSQVQMAMVNPFGEIAYFVDF